MTIIQAEERVNAALAAYFGNAQNAGAGWDVLRYAKAGYITIKNPDFTQEFTAWYPRNPDYLILRMAAAGQLEYLPRPETETEEN